MNDFDARARTAARAVHDLVASDTTLAVDTVTVPPRRRGTMRALLAAAAVVVVAAIVGGVIVTNRDGGPTAAEVSAFCDAVTTAMTDTTGLSRRVVDLAPEEIRADAEVVARNHTVPPNSDAAAYRALETSGGRFLAWIETNCYPAAAQPGAAPADQRFAPVPFPAGTRPCFVTNGNAIAGGSARQAPSHLTVFGDPRLADPWSGPLLALVVGHDADQLLTDEQAVGVPGIADARTGPVADASRQPIPDSRGIAWTDESTGGDSVAVLARNGGSADLESVAATVVRGPSGYRLGSTPAGTSVLFDGDLPSVVTSPLGGSLDTTFAVTAATDTETVTPIGSGGIWSGSVGGQPEVDAARLQLVEPTIRTIAGRSVLEWDTSVQYSTATGSTTVRWAEPSGVVLTATVSGADAGGRERRITDLVTSMKQLNREQWTDLTKQFSYCGMLSTLGRSEASGGSGSAKVEVSPTSTTVPVPQTATTVPTTGP